MFVEYVKQIFYTWIMTNEDQNVIFEIYENLQRYFSLFVYMRILIYVRTYCI